MFLKALTQKFNQLSSLYRNITTNASKSIDKSLSPELSKFYKNMTSTLNLASTNDIYVSSNFLNWTILNSTDSLKNLSYQLVIYEEENIKTKQPKIYKNFKLLTNKLSGSKSKFKIYGTLLLPLSPQNITYMTPSAVAITPTLRGVVVEHNEPPIRQIQLSGTTGILPLNNASIMQETGGGLSALANKMIKGTLKSVFNTQIQAAYNAVNTAQQIYNTITSISSGAFSPHPKTDAYYDIITNEKNLPAKTGYTAIHELQRFLDVYLYHKKINPKIKLGFESFKDKLYCEVVLQQYSINKSAGTLLYTYNINLSYIKRYETPISAIIYKINRSAEQDERIFSILSNSANLIRQSLSVVNNILNTVNISAATKQLINNISFEMSGIAAATAGIDMTIKEIVSLFSNKTIVQSYRLYQPTTPTNSLSLQSPNSTSPPNNQITDDNTQTSELITPEDDRYPQTEMIDNISISYLQNKYNTLQQKIIELEKELITDSDSYIPPTIIFTLQKLYDILQSISDIIVVKKIKNKQEESTIDVYEELLNNSDIILDNYISKFYVPFPAGGSLEQLAIQYLGDESKWIEIAAINKLLPPYIDEEGQKLPILSIIYNKISIPYTKELYINQIIEIGSNTQALKKFKINNIIFVSQSQIDIILNTQSLQEFILEDQPYIKWYKPNTINSQKMIAIPSNIPPSLLPLSDLNLNPHELKNIDMIAQHDVGLVFNKDGTADILIKGNDIVPIGGMQNLIQAVYIKLLTHVGELLNDPTFGNPIEIGSNINDIDVDYITTQIKNLFINDDRFYDVGAVNVEFKKNALNVQLLLIINNSQVVLPLSIDIPVI